MQITANSLEGQLSQLDKQFLNVEATAKSFETLEGKASAILHNALEQVYTFGEMLFGIKPQAGVSLTHKFFEKHKIPYNSRTQANPYIGLLKLAFTAKGNDSSRSQYATVLSYAASLGKTPQEFPAWLKEKGIEGWRSKALDEQNSRGRAIRDQGRQTRVQRAETILDAKPRSAAVALPAGVKAGAGYALVLAKIDGSGSAEIVEVVHDDAAKVEPILLSMAGDAPKQSSEPLAPFFRAIDLIVNTTPDKTQGKERDLLIRNRVKRGKKVATIEAVSEADSFPGAVMTLTDHVGDLPEDQPFILTAGDARHLLTQVEKLTGWTLDSAGEIKAQSIQQPIHLHQITSAGSYRVAQAAKTPSKPLKTLSSEFEQAARYIEHERQDHARKNTNRGESRSFAGSARLSIQDAKLSFKLPQSGRHAIIGETGAASKFDGVTIAVKDMEGLATTLARHDVNAHGWIMDGDVDDAALVLEVHFDNDLFRIVMPTRTGTDYNKVCEALVL
ncbi:hypothetical protein [Sphingomonas sp. Leaf28]|uniref:hypothetical protein n=1 Tax=Sphingomonas sp. Leaf28 TaxID=1735695 RepID=UPI0006FC17E9|nr:hypothetical protein [Sphingomonas sp. Leaf28]KQN09057.1 hypothetical protein ASE79_14490 [Sphingomonas sp. Leaf28]